MPQIRTLFFQIFLKPHPGSLFSACPPKSALFLVLAHCGLEMTDINVNCTVFTTVAFIQSYFISSSESSSPLLVSLSGSSDEDITLRPLSSLASPSSSESRLYGPSYPSTLMSRTENPSHLWDVFFEPSRWLLPSIVRTSKTWFFESVGSD